MAQLQGVMNFALQFLLDDDEEEEMAAVIELLNIRIRRYNYGVVGNPDLWRTLEDPTFKQHFRMNRDTFQRLLFAFGNQLLAQNEWIRRRTPLDLSLMMALWILSTNDTFRSTAVKFHCERSSVFFHYRRAIRALRQLAPYYITWPSARERDAIRARYERRYGYMGCVGCIDGVHIFTTAPLVGPRRYFNRHHTYSVLCQAVADDRMLYRDVFIGQPGGVGDRRTFTRSPLYRNLFDQPDMLRPDEHLVGDKAYPLLDKLMIPYVNDGHLTPEQLNHNRILSGARSSVERSFARFKGKFRRMKHIQSFSIDVLLDHIMATFFIHNFVLLAGEPMTLHPVAQAVPRLPTEQQIELSEDAGALKREYICARLAVAVN